MIFSRIFLLFLPILLLFKTIDTQLNEEILFDLVDFQKSLNDPVSKAILTSAINRGFTFTYQILTSLLMDGSLTPTECRSQFNQIMLEELGKGLPGYCVTGVTESESSNAQSCSYGNYAILTRVKCGSFYYKYRYVLYPHDWDYRSVFKYTGKRGYNMWGYYNCNPCRNENNYVEVRAGMKCNDNRINTCKKYSLVVLDEDRT